MLAPFRPDQAFLRLTVVFTLARIVSVGVGLQLAPLFLASGATPVVAALAGAMGLASLPGRMLFVALLRRLGLQTLTCGLLTLLGLGALLLNLPGYGTGAVGGVTAFGLANGALTLARTELLMERYPAAQFGTVNGRMALPVNLAQALTPFAVGLIFTWTGSYRPSLLLLCALALGATRLLVDREPRPGGHRPRRPGDHRPEERRTG